MKFRKSVVAGVAAGTMLMGSGVAYAYVKIAGSGTSEAKVVASQGFSMLVTPAGITGLTPGAAASALPVTVKNTGPSKIQINTVVLSLSSNCGGTITVQGHNIVVPKETIVLYPANASTWQEMFAYAPAPYGLGTARGD